MMTEWQLKALAHLDESDSSEEDRIREMVNIGFDQLKHYKPALVTQIKKIMDYLVKQDVVEYGSRFRGQYSVKDRSKHTINSAEDMVVKAWRDGKINVKLNPSVNEDYQSDVLALLKKSGVKTAFFRDGELIVPKGKKENGLDAISKRGFGPGRDFVIPKVIEESILNEDSGDASVFINVADMFDVKTARKAGVSQDTLRNDIEESISRKQRDIMKLIKKDLEENSGYEGLLK
jgi:hypothetical protein